MVIHKLHLVRMAINPLKTDSPLPVYSQTVQVLHIARLAFQPVAGRVA